jgi:hypothetical protein
MALNFTEKQHWKSRVEAKLDQYISTLRVQNAKLLASIESNAREQAITSLGLTKDFQRLKQIDKTINSLEAEKAELILGMLTKHDKKPRYPKWAFHNPENVISTLQREKADELLSEHKVGRQLASLQQDKERLADAILLTTNVQQIIDIWDQVTSLITASPVAEPDALPLFEGEQPEAEDN